MENIPGGLWIKIMTLACTDGGATGCSLSLVSRHMHDMVQPVRYHSVVISSIRSASTFAHLLERQSPAPVVRHLMIKEDTKATRPLPHTSKEAVSCILRHTAATLYTLFWSEKTVWYGHEGHEIFPTLAFPVLANLSIPTVDCWEELAVTPFPSLQRLHIHNMWVDDPDCIWAVLAQACPSIAAVRLSGIYSYFAGHLPQILRALLRVPATACPTILPAQINDETMMLLERLPRVTQVTIEEAIDPDGARYPPPSGPPREIVALHEISRACEGEHRLSINSDAERYEEETAWTDWLDVVGGGDGPWCPILREIDEEVVEAKYVILALYVAQAVANV